MAGEQRHDLCLCGARKQVESTVCIACTRKSRLKTKTEGPNKTLRLEPRVKWDCPDCLYVISDEQSVVADAVRHHRREVHG